MSDEIVGNLQATQNSIRLLKKAGVFSYSVVRNNRNSSKSQIVTPDVQPQGDFSLSFQWQGKEIANPYEFQAELGITRSFEVAIFQGIQPSETIFGCEVALVQKDPWLLTTGFINWSTQGI